MSSQEIKNRLYYGDCLTIMQSMPNESIDLIYLDPPFNSARDYNTIYEDATGIKLPEQIAVFRDTWKFDEERELALTKLPILMRKYGIDDDAAEFWRGWMNALKNTNSDLLAYLSYMAERLLPMKRLLKPNGSIYLHCDTTASHYIKIMMDIIFGHKNFINEIIWHYQTGGASKRWFSKKHDTIFLYANGENYTFNDKCVQVPRTPASIRRAQNPTGARIAADDKTKTAMDVWTDLNALNPMANERLGYATQKPLALLERIILASSNKGDVVFDPFCGCATTIEAAHILNRNWIGIDIAIHAIKRVAKVRLNDKLGLLEGVDFIIEGVPKTYEGAKDLWTRDKYHFQKWAVEEINGFVTTKQSADGGIDGRLYFTNDITDKELYSMVLEVKGGENVGISVIRELRGVLDRDDAVMAGLIILEPLKPTRMSHFKKEMALAGHLEVNGVSYPKMQMLNIDQILAGENFKIPGRVSITGLTEPYLKNVY